MDPGRPWESVRDEPVGTTGGSRTLALNVFHFVTPLLSPAAVPAGGMCWGLMFRGRGHVRSRCHRSHLEQKKREQPKLCTHKGDKVKHTYKGF